MAYTKEFEFGRSGRHGTSDEVYTLNLGDIVKKVDALGGYQLKKLDRVRAGENFMVYHFESYQSTVTLSTHTGRFVPKGKRNREGHTWAYCCGTIAGATQETVEKLYGELEKALMSDSK